MEILLNIIYYIVPFIILLGILVFVHEFGHFIVARMLGVSVAAFSIGFGKELWSKTDKYGTRWKVSAIPLGGYCQFLGDADASSSTAEDGLEKLTDEQKKHAFALQSAWKKLAIVLAGPGFNYLFAILVFIGIFYSFGKIVYPSVVGSVLPGEAADTAGIKAGDTIISVNGVKTPDFQAISNEVALAPVDNVKVEIERPLTVNLQSELTKIPNRNGSFREEKIVGIISMRYEIDKETGKKIPAPAVVGNIFKGSAAERAGVARGDIIDSINGAAVSNFDEFRDYIAAHQDEPLEIKFRRPLVIDVVLKDTSFDAGNGQKVKRRMLGIQSSPDIVFTEKNMGFVRAVEAGCVEAWNLTVTTLRSVGQMITGQRGGKEVGGIIRIAEMSGDISKNAGLVSFIYFMALLSVNLGLINLLPIPVLDGGHVVIYLGELITRRELKAEIKDYIFKFGLLIILAIMVLATWNDVVHLISRWFD